MDRPPGPAVAEVQQITETWDLDATPSGLSLYRETFPPVTGVPRARHASAMPRQASENWKKTSGFSGLPKLRQLVMPTGLAPVAATLRADSATAAFPPSYGSSDT